MNVLLSARDPDHESQPGVLAVLACDVAADLPRDAFPVGTRWMPNDCRAEANYAGGLIKSPWPVGKEQMRAPRLIAKSCSARCCSS